MKAMRMKHQHKYDYQLRIFELDFSLTFLFLQEVNGPLQDGGFVHLAGVTLTL